MKDDQIAVKMLSRYKEIRKNTFKKMADVEMMLGLLDVVREYDIQPTNKEFATDAEPCFVCGEVGSHDRNCPTFYGDM